jgi:hypothetical protein
MAANAAGAQSTTGTTNLVSVATTLFGTLIASHIARRILYRITNNDELWFLVFLELFVLLTIGMVAYRYMYKPQREDEGEGYRSRLMALFFLQMTALLTAMRFLVDMLSYAMSITALTLSAYYLLLSLGITFVFVLLYKLQKLIE